MRNSKTGQCIYCGKEKQLSQEHYLPYCLGAFLGFEGLNDRICICCNGAFSGIEGHFCRTGVNAALRRFGGMKGRKHHSNHDPFWDIFCGIPPVEVIDRDTMARFEPSGSGDFTGRDMCQIIMTDSQGRRHPLPISGNMIRDKEALKDHLKGKFEGFDFASEEPIELYYEDEEEMQAMIDAIDELGIRYERFVERETPSGPQVLNMTMLAPITVEQMRAVAKIAFHYFLKHFPRYRGSEPHFDEIRKFIKTGENVQSDDDVGKFVRIRPLPLGSSQVRGSVPDWRGHMVAAGMNYHVFCGLAQFFICPEFVTPTYMVLLGRNPSPVDYAEEHAYRFIFYDNGKQDRHDGYMEETFRPKVWLPSYWDLFGLRV